MAARRAVQRRRAACLISTGYRASIHRQWRESESTLSLTNLYFDDCVALRRNRIIKDVRSFDSVPTTMLSNIECPVCCT